MEQAEFLRALAEELAHDLAPIDRIKRFTNNSAIIGAHAESAVRQFVSRASSPLSVSTGAIIYEGNTGPNSQTPQIDTMLWWMGTAPAIFHSGDFALVPRGSCFGALEIKRSMYSGSGDAAESVLSHNSELFTLTIVRDGETLPRMLAVFCTEGDSPDAAARSLIDAGQALLLLKREGNKHVPNHADILRFVNFILDCRFLALQSRYTTQVEFSLVDGSSGRLAPVPPCPISASACVTRADNPAGGHDPCH